MIWRLVAIEKVTTLKELDTHWTLPDIFDAHAALDYRDYCQKYYMDKSKQEQKINEERLKRRPSR